MAGAIRLPISQLTYSEDNYSYGIQYNTTVASPTLTRIGNVNFHASLPAHNILQACVLNDIRSYF